MTRLRAQEGFTMIFALGVLLVTALLTAAVFTAVQGDASLTRGDLDGKRAYSAAHAAVETYLHSLNSLNATNSPWWKTCANDTTTNYPTGIPVPGTTTGTSYAYTPVPIAPYTACNMANPTASLIDTGTGTLRVKFTGYSGNAEKTIVASFKTVSPLSYVWHTVHETVDGDSTCSRFYSANPPPQPSCYIYWHPGDQVNGPLYTQDELLIGAGTPGPIFGRTAKDTIVSQSGTTSVCADQSGTPPCQNAQFRGQAVLNPSPQVLLPSGNYSNLLADATANGTVLIGTTTLTVSGAQATGSNCTTSLSCKPVQIELTKSPIIYAVNGAGCTSTYTPGKIVYPQITTTGQFYGPCGDIYIKGSYSTPLTIAADNDVIVTGNFTNSTDANFTGTASPTGSATLGLLATRYVRVYHDCQQGNPNVTIDAAILAVTHSFFVDNDNCGGASGTLTVHGAIAQQFGGIVGTPNSSGYLKSYNYDDRLGLILPPYLFDLQNTQWGVYRETLCDATAASSLPTSCLYTGP